MNQDTLRHQKQGKRSYRATDDLNQNSRERAAYRLLNPRAGESAQDYFERFPVLDALTDLHVSKLETVKQRANPFTFRARYSPLAENIG